jgi:hypothetical protein
VLGPYDFVNIVEAPDTGTIARFSAALSSRGYVRVLTLPAIPLDQFVQSFASSATRPAATPAPPGPRSRQAENASARRSQTSSRARRTPEGIASQVANPIQVQAHLRDVGYPVEKRVLVETARREGADEIILNTLERLPERSYEGPTGVAEAIGNLRSTAS